MIISEPGERARHTSPTDADTHGPKRKKTQCCGEKKDTNTVTHQHSNTLAKQRHSFAVRTRTQTQRHCRTQIHWQKQRHSVALGTKDTNLNKETQLHKYTVKNKDTVMWQVQENKDMTLQLHSNTQ